MFNIFLLIVSYVSSTSCQELLRQPEQIHLSYGSSPSEMVVTWVTLNDTLQVSAEYFSYDGTTTMRSTEGYTRMFQDGGPERRRIYIHRVTMVDLVAGRKYSYRVGSDADGWSGLYFFWAMKNPGKSTFAVLGDMGNINAISLVELQKMAQGGAFDAVIHVGDFAYNMDTDNAKVGDAYMRQTEAFSAYLPYMTCVGNHEQAYNFSNYKARFSMPGGDGEGMFYSVDIGLIHLVAFSSEFYYFPMYGWRQIEQQFDWLEKDLEEANRPENRAKRPWLVTMCHRPMYCSNSNDQEHCNKPDNMIRVGFPGTNTYNIEDLLYKHGVDLHFQAHEHSYERMWPVYDNVVCNGSSDKPYKDPRAPVHIVTGSGGCQEGLDPFVRQPNVWSAYHADDYGFTMMTIHNQSHMSLDQISVEKGNSIIDSILIEKTSPASDRFDCHQQKPHH